MLPALNENKKSIIIVVVLAVSIMLTQKRAEKYGDMLQIMLPVLAGACALANGNFGDFATRLGALQLAIHIPKNTLGEIPINLRPSGNTGGFPSGHTASATFGATSLIFNCVQGNVWVKSALVLTAAFTGTSRLEAEKHNIWQVFAGWIIGFFMASAWRKGSGPYGVLKQLANRRKKHTNKNDKIERSIS
ncbi:phosphatase PAP2 family protein [Lentilitoribacter sp. EG35]|jgi:membrane-associated phospholipid phosphatase|uniref:phosphatase PAP2 family protein n=1 Tax=Lentilitoribacter sp. EG35 TaxID=3234192 RepID=UPI00345F1D9C